MAYQLTYRRYRLPLRHVVRTAHGVRSEREGLLLRLTDAAGRVGLGEVAPLPEFGTATVEQAESQLRRLGAAVERDAGAWATLDGCVRFGLATAIADLEAPVVAATRDYWPVAALLPAGRAALAVVRELGEAGFRTFKWKVGVADPADELGLLDDLLARLPDGARLRLDPNGAWNRRQAERWLERCAERPIELVEQPLAAGSAGADDGLRGLAADYPTPLALDESLVTAQDLQRWLESGWSGIYVIKLALLGDPQEVIARLQAAKADVVFSSALETRVGATAGLRQIFQWGGEPRALGYGVWPLFADAAFDGPHRAPFIRLSDLPAAGSLTQLWEASA